MKKIIYRFTCDNAPVPCFSKIEILHGNYSSEYKELKKYGWTIHNGKYYCPLCAPYGKRLKAIKKNKKTKMINRK